MKRISTILTAILITVTASAQSPEKMSYQSVIRDASDQLVTNQDMGMQISILQGSAGGTAVYIETHSPTTNANGLVSIEIGTGTTSDDFSAIDWTSGPYFLKTETDPTISGGTNYTITGTSQLLSVPYSLHAKTVENVDYTQITNTPFIPVDISDLTDNSSLLFDGQWSSLSGTVPNVSIFNNDAGYLTSFTETDPIFTSSQAYNITTTDITNLSNLSGTNTGDQDLSSLATQSALEDTAFDIRAEIPNVTTYSVGDFAQGGIVFWVDETGQHGLVCAKTDQSTAIRWYAGTNGNTQAKGNGPYAGEANTAIIISAQVAIGDDGNTFAARMCNELQITEGGKTYGDWYLPSRQELNLMHQNRTTINTTATANGGASFGTGNYWSSTEYLSNTAWIQIFPDGAQGPNPKDFTHRLRAIRAF